MDIPDRERAIEHRPARQEWNEFIDDIEAMIACDPDSRVEQDRQTVKWHDDNILHCRYILSKRITSEPDGFQFTHYVVKADSVLDPESSIISFRDNSWAITRISGPALEWSREVGLSEDEQENYRFILGMFLASNPHYRPYR